MHKVDEKRRLAGCTNTKRVSFNCLSYATAQQSHFSILAVLSVIYICRERAKLTALSLALVVYDDGTVKQFKFHGHSLGSRVP